MADDTARSMAAGMERYCRCRDSGMSPTAIAQAAAVMLGLALQEAGMSPDDPMTSVINGIRLTMRVGPSLIAALPARNPHG
jgi:hypothetical protein